MKILRNKSDKSNWFDCDQPIKKTIDYFKVDIPDSDMREYIYNFNKELNNCETYKDIAELLNEYTDLIDNGAEWEVVII